MYNILEVEDKIKGLPDQVLIKEAQFPSGDVPQFLVVSELQRRNQMRKSYEATQQQSTTPVAQQIVAEAGQGISGIVGGNALPVSAPMQAQTPMDLPMQSSMAAPQAPAGIVGMQSGRRVPFGGFFDQVAAQENRNLRDSIEELAKQLRDTGQYNYSESIEEAASRINNPEFSGLPSVFASQRNLDSSEPPLASLDQTQSSSNTLDVIPTIAEQETQTTSPQDISINMPALSGSQGLAGFNIPAGRAVTTDISKLIDKEILGSAGQMSVDDIVSGLTLGGGDIELPAGADFASIAKARAERSEAASTRMEELIQSIQDKAKSDALNMALINIGAGVAAGDLAGGLERAGSVAGQISSDARDAARALELQQITMAEEGARSSEDIQMQEALSDLQRFSVEQGIAKDQRDYNLSLIRTRIEADLGLRKLAADLTQSENISKRSVLSLISDVIKEEAEAAENAGEPYDAASRALTLYNPFAGLFGLDSLSTAELNNALGAIGTQSAVETDPADLEAALDSFISR